MSLRATATLNRYDGKTVTVELHQVGYAGSAVQAALRSLEIRWQTDDPLSPFLPSSASIGLIITDDALINALTSSYPEDREWKVRVLIDSGLLWEGWVLPDQITWSLDLTRGKLFDLEATDGLALLDKEPVGSRTGFVRIADFLAECLNVIGLGTDWALWNDYMMSSFTTQYDLADVEVRWDRYADVSLREMMADVLGRFALRIWRQAIWLVGSSRSEAQTTWAYFQGGTRVGTAAMPAAISGWESDVKAGSLVRRIVPVRRVVVRYKAGDLVSNPSSLIRNGGFDSWPDATQPPTSWSWTTQMDRLGDIDGGSGYSVGLPVVLIPDPSSPPDTAGNYIEQLSDTTLAAGTGHLKLSLRTNLIKAGTTVSDPSDRPIAVVIQVGSYYWDGTQQAWTTGFAYATVKAGFGTEQHIIETGLLPNTGAPLVRIYNVSDWNGDVSGCYLDDVVLEFVASGNEYVVEEQATAVNQNSETIDREYRIGDGPSLDWSGAMRYGGTVTGPWSVGAYSGSIDYVRANDELEIRSPALLMYDVEMDGQFLPYNTFTTNAGLSRILELEIDLTRATTKIRIIEKSV